MLSIILSSRVKDNPDSNLRQLFDSAAACITNPDDVEWLIRFDKDDDQRPPPSFFAAYPFTVRTYEWQRGEGRHQFNFDHTLLFSYTNPQSRFFLVVADDFQFTRRGFDQNILAIKDEYCFVNGFKHCFSEAIIAGDYDNPHVLRALINNCWNMMLPCCSRAILESIGGFGYQANADNFFTFMAWYLYHDFKVDLWRTIEPFYKRNPQNGRSGFGSSYNLNELDAEKMPQNHYYWRLVYKLARNIYLNYQYDYPNRKN